MRYILVLLLIFPLIAQNQTISARIYEIPISQNENQVNTFSLNDVTGESQDWYRITILKLEGVEPYPSNLEVCGGQITLGIPYLDIGNTNYYPAGFEFQIIDDESGIHNLIDSNYGDAVMTVYGNPPMLRIKFLDCQYYGGDEYFTDAVLTVILESNFQQSEDDYGADWNGDGEINIIDVVAIIDYILYEQG